MRLSDLEKSWFSQVHERLVAEVPFWLVALDGSQHVSAKLRQRRLVQQVVSHFQGRILLVQVGEGAYLPPLKGVLDLRGQTDRRQLARLVYHAQGVLCPAGALMRLAAAVEVKGGTSGSRPGVLVGDGREQSPEQVIRRINSCFARRGLKLLTARQRRLAQAAIVRQRKRMAEAPLATEPPMLERVFAVACDGGYYPGLLALLNSIAAYHAGRIPVFLYHRGLSETQLAAVRRHRVPVRLFELTDLPFPSPGMWEAKQQVFAHCLGRARCVCLLDADLVLVSALDDVFARAGAGKVVGSADGRGLVFDSSYAAYSAELPGTAQPYINSGALCLDVIRHWDLAGLWAFASKYGRYSPGGGAPLGLPGHGDQGVFNAVAGLLRRTSAYRVLPEGTWCDSTRGCRLRIKRRGQAGRLEVWNLDERARQRVVHSSGPKWWTAEGTAYLKQFGDKLACFEHFAALKPRSPTARPARRAVAVKPSKRIRTKLLLGICSHGAFQARRAAIRETWLQHLPKGAVAVFFLGTGARPEAGRVVQLPVRDDYSSLPRKVQAFFRYALEHYEFDYLGKCDDDTYVRVERLFELTKDGAEYIGGREWVREGYASGGAGYLLSRRAVKILAAALPARHGAEDVWVGGALREAGVKLFPTPRLRMDHREAPSPRNDLITAHWCSPELMRSIHHGFVRPTGAGAAVP